MSSAYLAVELDGAGRHPAAWRLFDARPGELFTAGYWTELAQLADGAGLDFLAIPDSFVPPTEGQAGLVRGRLDAVAIAARVAPLTRTVGLVPTATVTHTEPFHLSKAIATLDFVSLGRAGWQPEVSRTRDEADLFGRKAWSDGPAPADPLWRELADAVEVVVRLWDSWEDDAVIRDQATGRYVDRDKLHYIDFAGEFFSVKGPSITPRSPQAHPPVVLRADEPEALPVVGRWAQVVRIAAPDLAAASAARARVRDAVAAAGRDPDEVAVLLDVETLLADTTDQAQATLAQLDGWAGAGGFALRTHTQRAATAEVIGTPAALADLIEDAVRGRAADGVTLVPLALPSGLRFIADRLVPLLAERELRSAADGGPLRIGAQSKAAADHPATLRDRFGLVRPANYFTEARA
ncbi:MAG TPA: LLM class flavin-dependent oxidoreductase [Pseudonocardia sp.]|jgi:alkanesulfonate monooxygenase SsuD/methylene tetrahydromethanopterin reductase-like flavin-dependent oxidoreductase (luciferase family)|uniref:LLM class flavin-dependent oxidoreductase n=1 Tax=Pseudonocardia sp. TaxID=60912 RepID=UPI002ED842AA